MTTITRLTNLLGGLLLAATGPIVAQQPAGSWPAAPAVHGDLKLQVAYPAAGSRIDAADSIFLFGTSGDGSAKVTVAGHPAVMSPNGGWVAWVAVPDDSAFVLAIVATRGHDSVAVALPLSHAGWVRESGAWVDRGSMMAIGDVVLPSDELLPLSVRAAPGATVRLRLPNGAVVPFAVDSIAGPVPEGIRAFDRDDANLRRAVRGDRYVAVLPLNVGSAASNLFAAATSDASLPVLEVALGHDTTRTPWPLTVRRWPHRPVAVIVGDAPRTGDSATRMIVGRAYPGGTYTWFLPRGTRTRADMRIGDQVRLRLAHDAVAWVASADVHPVAAADDVRPGVVGSLTLTPESGWTRLRIPLTRPVPLAVEETSRGLAITLFDAVSNINWIRYGAAQRFVELLSWRQDTDDRVTLTATLDRALWGWRARVDGTDLVLDFREPPAINPARPLAGRRIVVDPGHPPGGACGPTGLCEPEANLAVANAVRDRLTAAGATVVMTRESADPVSLAARVALADSVDAELLVSIHDNALPDGVNPFTNSGSSTFFNHPASLPLARAVQQRLVAALGVGDLGVARGDLALVRPTWYPAILTEGLFMMFPDQEAALRTPEGQQRYAGAIVAGITDFLHGVNAGSTGH